MIAIDLGNTKTAVGFFQEGKLAHQWRFSTQPHRSADEYRFLLQSSLSEVSESFEKLSNVVLSSVVPSATREIEKLKRFFDLHVVSDKTPTSFTIQLSQPHTLGSDRIADAEAAVQKFGAPVLIVNTGTAITASAIDSQKRFLGGTISPGVGISMDALFERAARLNQTELDPPKKAIGTTTKEALESGLYFGYSSLVQGLIDRLSLEIGSPKPTVVITGGAMKWLQPYLKPEYLYEENLTLEGLYFLHQNLRRKKNV